MKKCINVLVVDDDPDMADMVKLILTESGIVQGVATANTMWHALLNIRDAYQPFDLVITDFEIEKGRGGEEIVGAARQRSAHTRTIVVSGAMASKGNLIRDLCPANGFLEKPYKIDALTDLVTQVLDLREQPVPA